MKTIAVIGGGPAGYVAAITAAQNGEKVILIEENEVGGVCFNDGCIPAKSLLKSAETVEYVQHARHFGVDLPIDEVRVNWNKIQDYKNNVVNQLVEEINQLIKKNQIRLVNGRGRFITNQTVQITGPNVEETITADRIIIATGSDSNVLPTAPYDGKWVIDSADVQRLPKIPTTMLIIGGGVIGCEYASVFSRLGTKVTFIDRSSQLLKGEDPEIAAILQRKLEHDGVTIHLNSELQQINVNEKKAIFGNGTETFTEYPDYVLVSIGRSSRVEDLNLDEIGVNYSRSGIEVNESMQTNIPHIYACGDVIGGMKLAHVGFHEGKIAALHASGRSVKVNYTSVPRCIYTTPEIACVGLTEEQAKEKYGDIHIGKSSFSENPKAAIHHESEGIIKVIIEPHSDEIVGFSIVGPRATELIGQGAVILHAKLTYEQMKDGIVAHPTLSESLQEATLDAKGRAVYV